MTLRNSCLGEMLAVGQEIKAVFYTCFKICNHFYSCFIGLQMKMPKTVSSSWWE